MSLVNKMIRAAKLDVLLYEEVEKDIEATKEAFLVVLIVGLCSVIGGVGFLGAKGIIIGIVSEIIGWLLWSTIIYLIGVKIFKHTSDMGELLRRLGFAFSPRVLSILDIIPVIGFIIFIITLIWTLLAFVIAARQALDCGTGRAILIVILGSIPYFIIHLLWIYI